MKESIVEEQREMERKKRLFREEEKQRKIMKLRYQKEATEVQLGERDVISKEVMEAHENGYRNLVKDTSSMMLHKKGFGLLGAIGHGPRVRIPPTGYHEEPKMDREFYLKRQAAGGGVPSHSQEAQERNWEMTVATLFC